MDSLTYIQIGQSVGLLLLFSFLVIFTVKVILGNIRQYKNGRCVVCKGRVDWDVVKEEFEDMFPQIDYWGVDSLTENQQVVFERKCCSYECYENMNTVIIEV